MIYRIRKSFEFKGEIKLKLSKLLSGVSVKNEYEDVEIRDIVSNTNADVNGCLFVCIAGKKFDPHNCAQELMQRGAAAILVERDLGIKNQVIVENTRSANALICANFFGNPSKKLKLIGVTGTNGKTSSVAMIKTILDSFGCKTGLIGTVNCVIDEEIEPSKYTTPEPYDLHRLFAKMVDAGCEYCVMEASSQGLEQHRVDGCQFEVAIFTNLTHEHLDYHKNMENYLEAKRILFKMSKTVVVNADDLYADDAVKDLECRVVTFSSEKDTADYVAKNIRCRADGVCYELIGDGTISRVRVPIPGSFTVSNSMGAVITGVELGFGFYDCANALANAKSVKGRLEVIPTNTDYTVIVDYAHTPDGLEKMLSSLREFTTGRLISVFGCGGERDKEKRPVMGRIAAQIADFIVITSDNPRNEEPMDIAHIIEGGIKESGAKTPYTIVIDRAQAIWYAMDNAKEGDVIVISGKGPDSYQHTKEGKFYYSDEESVLNYFKK